MSAIGGTIVYWLAEHPAIVGFRWSHTHCWVSTWFSLVSAIAIYLAAAIFVDLLLRLIGRRRPLPLGPLPAAHSLCMSFVSAVIFLGTFLSSVSEIRDTRWFWLRRRTSRLAHPLQWLLCFPPGTRPSGRVFFWSYAFYLSRYLHLLRTFIVIARRRVGRSRSRSLSLHLFSHSVLVCMSFVWLEFSQSVQVMAILTTTLAYAVVYGYRFWVGVGLPWGETFPAVLGSCQSLLVGCNLLSHLGVLLLHFWNGGCNGIGAWVFNSVLNATLLLLFAANGKASRSWEGIADDDFSTRHPRRELASPKDDLVKKDL